MKARPTDSPRVLLGFDFGTKRIGVAIGQELTGTARALITLQSRHDRPDWEGISRLIEEWRPDAIVVGHPLNMDGTEQELTRRAHRFGNQLAGRYNLPVYEVDERLSSNEAERILKETNPRHARGEVDKLAAQLILQAWLDTKSR